MVGDLLFMGLTSKVNCDRSAREREVGRESLNRVGVSERVQNLRESRLISGRQHCALHVLTYSKMKQVRP